MINLEAIYTDVDDFSMLFIPQREKHLIEPSLKQCRKPSKISVSEMMTMFIAFHHLDYRDFKICHTNHTVKYWSNYFPVLKPIGIRDRLMSKIRFIIETVFEQLKNTSQIEYTRHRSCISFMVTLLAGLMAYTCQQKTEYQNISA